MNQCKEKSAHGRHAPFAVRCVSLGGLHCQLREAETERWCEFKSAVSKWWAVVELNSIELSHAWWRAAAAFPRPFSCRVRCCQRPACSWYMNSVGSSRRLVQANARNNRVRCGSERRKIRRFAVAAAGGTGSSSRSGGGGSSSSIRGDCQGGALARAKQGGTGGKLLCHHRLYGITNESCKARCGRRRRHLQHKLEEQSVRIAQQALPLILP